MPNPYPSTRVQALIDGHISIDGSWTLLDWRDLAMAALDQGGVSAADQARVRALIATTTPDWERIATDRARQFGGAL